MMSGLDESLGLKGLSWNGLTLQHIQNGKTESDGLNVRFTKKNTTDEYYICNIKGTSRSALNLTNSPRDQFISEAVSLLTSNFNVSEDMSFFLQNDLYSIFIISRKNTRTVSEVYIPIATLLYTYSPVNGLFCPLLAVDKKYRKMGFGKSIMGALQSIHFHRFNDMRISIWLSNSSQNKKHSSHLYQFYQSLGMHLIPPSDIAVRSLMRKELFQVLHESQALHSTDNINFVMGSFSNLYVKEKKIQIICKSSKDF